jgi:hypothetical protein
MIYLLAFLLVAVAALTKLLTVYAYEQGRRDEVVKRADLQAKLKERQTNVVMAPKTVDDTATDLDNGTF